MTFNRNIIYIDNNMNFENIHSNLIRPQILDSMKCQY